jgi:hypothetical protein
VPDAGDGDPDRLGAGQALTAVRSLGLYFCPPKAGREWLGAEAVARSAAEALAKAIPWDDARALQARLLVCLFGLRPFRPIAFDPDWRTVDAVGVARAIYDDRAFDRLPILADALMDAGCADEQVLAHCRSDGPHARGCWVVDLVLGLK